MIATAPRLGSYRIVDSRGSAMAPAAPARSGARRATYGNGFTGAAYSSARSILPGYVTDSRTEFDNWTRYEITRKARWFKKNFGLIRGMAKAIVNNSIGPGLYCIPATADDNWNEAAWDYIWKLFDSAATDVAGRLTMWEKQRRGIDHKFYDGDFFTLFLRGHDGRARFQTIRSHNCDNFDVDPEEGWQSGVKLDDQLQATAYRFRLRDGVYLTLPAKSVSHNYIFEDSDQIRGMTALQHALADGGDIVDSLTLTKATVKEIARRGVTIKTQSGEDEEDAGGNVFDTPGGTAGDRTDDEQDDLVPLEAVFGGGEIKRLRVGEELAVVNDSRPSPTFLGFIDWLGRAVSAGCDLPYEFSWDRKGLNSPAQRMVLEQAKTAFAMQRECEARDTFRFYTFAIACGIDNGELKPRADFTSVEFLSGAPEVTIDKGRDARADIEGLKAGLDTFKRYWAARGYWWKKMLTQKADEAAFIHQLAKSRGVSPDWIHQLTANNTGNPDQAAATAPVPLDE